MRRYDRKKENVMAAIISVPLIIIVCLLAFFAARGDMKQQEAATAAKEATKQQMQATEDLVIETPEPCTEGTILITANGGVYGFYGDIVIKNDGTDGEQIDIALDGYIVDTYPHSATGEPQIYEP